MSLSSVFTSLVAKVQALENAVNVISASNAFATKGDVLPGMYGKSISFAKLVALKKALEGGATSVSYAKADTSNVDLSNGCKGYNMVEIYKEIYENYRSKITDFDEYLLITDKNGNDVTPQFWRVYSNISVVCDGTYKVLIVETNETSSGWVGFRIIDRATGTPATAVYGSVKLYTVPKLDENGKVMQGASVAELRGFGKAVDGEVLFVRGFFSPSFLFYLGQYKGKLEAQLYVAIPG